MSKIVLIFFFTSLYDNILYEESESLLIFEKKLKKLGYTSMEHFKDF